MNLKLKPSFPWVKSRTITPASHRACVRVLILYLQPSSLLMHVDSNGDAFPGATGCPQRLVPAATREIPQLEALVASAEPHHSGTIWEGSRGCKICVSPLSL